MSRRARVFHAILILCLSIPVVAQESSIAPQPLSIDGATTYVYKSINGTALRLYVFSPPNHSSATRRPAILFFFGGGWTRGDVRQFVPQSQHLADRGMVAIVADYRVFGRHKTSPFEAIADAKSAIRWVRSRAVELGIDPDRIAGAAARLADISRSVRRSSEVLTSWARINASAQSRTCSFCSTPQLIPQPPHASVREAPKALLFTTLAAICHPRSSFTARLTRRHLTPTSRNSAHGPRTL